jgi:hypothetical protein
LIKIVVLKKTAIMSKARGLFDEQIRLEKLSKKQDPLERLLAHIDFEFFCRLLEKALGKTDYSRGGRPGYDYVLCCTPISGQICQ